MAFRKRTFRRRAPFRRRRVFRRRTGGIRRTIQKVMMATKEPKYAEAIVSNQSADSTGIITSFSMPTQGDAYNQRDGDVLQWRALYGQWNANVADPTNQVRFTLIQWLPDTGGEVPTMAKIFENASYPWNSTFQNALVARKKFRVLYDKKVALSTGMGSATCKINVNVKKMARVYFAGGGTTGKGIIYYIYSSDSTTISHPTVSFFLSYKWSDI